MQLDVKIFRDDRDGYLYLCIGETRQKVSSLEQAAFRVAEYIKDNFEDDGADICYRVR